MRFRLILASRLLGVTLLAAASAWATTLEQLSVEQMIQQSTAIVRAKVTGSFTANRNGAIYTYYRLQVTEDLKSTVPASMAATMDVAVPGGVLGRVIQSVAGAPELKTGGDYVLFLWTSRSGLTQIIGLSQGAFDVRGSTLARPAGEAQMLDSTGRMVVDPGVTLGLSDLRARLQFLTGGTR